MNISCFYTDDVKVFLLNICRKIIKERKKTLFIFQNLEQLDFFDNEVWKFDFLPHCKIDSELRSDSFAIFVTQEEFLAVKLDEFESILFCYQVEERILKNIETKTAIVLTDFEHKYDKIEVRYFKKNNTNWELAI